MEKLKENRLLLLQYFGLVCMTLSVIGYILSKNTDWMFVGNLGLIVILLRAIELKNRTIRRLKCH